MNVQGTIESSMDEEYWQAILSQGEVPVKQFDVETTGPWEGFQHPLTNTLPNDDTPHEQQDSSSNDRWALAHTLLETGEVLELKVTGYNRGGLLVDWDGLRGFVPASHLLGFSSYLDEEGRRLELERRVGMHLRLRVIELDPEEDRFILSERVATDEGQRRAKLLVEIQPGDVRQGCVTNLCSFGAFVDLGGVEGLIHISELSWGRIDHPRDVLKSGQLVDVYVLNVNPAQGRVGLSLKRLLPDPWKTVEDRYEPDQLVEGVITNVVSFGAFARLEEGLEGLIHVSELAEGNFLHPRNVVQEGEKVTVLVLSVDGQRRRMALSLRQVDRETLSDEKAKEEVWTASSTPAVVYQP
jgi:small subunit ribosomal protein S1